MTYHDVFVINMTRSRRFIDMGNLLYFRRKLPYAISHKWMASDKALPYSLDARDADTLPDCPLDKRVAVVADISEARIDVPVTEESSVHEELRPDKVQEESDDVQDVTDEIQESSDDVQDVSDEIQESSDEVQDVSDEEADESEDESRSYSLDDDGFVKCHYVRNK